MKLFRLIYAGIYRAQGGGDSRPASTIYAFLFTAIMVFVWILAVTNAVLRVFSDASDFHQTIVQKIGMGRDETILWVASSLLTYAFCYRKIELSANGTNIGGGNINARCRLILFFFCIAWVLVGAIGSLFPVQIAALQTTILAAAYLTRKGARDTS